MIEIDVHLTDVNQQIVMDSKSITFGGSRIEKFDSNFVNLAFTESSGGFQIWVGEEDDPSQNQTVEDSLAQVRAVHSSQGLKLFINKGEGAPSVCMARTDSAGCPLYVAHNRDRIVMSWKFETVAAALPEIMPNKEACRRFFEHGPRVVREQILTGMLMLWPGERLHFDGEKIEIVEVQPQKVVQSGILNDTARATDYFVELISEFLGPRLKKAGSPLLELSGGLDSSCIAIGARKVRSDLCSYAAVQQGAIGKQQTTRRAELVALLGLKDATGPSDIIGPFSALSLDECTVTPLDDNYRMSCLSALDCHPVKNVDLVVTGLGGDELTMENTVGRKSWEVRSSIASSASDAVAGRADMFMRRGIWVTHPFSSRGIVDFCRALPSSMRNDRILNILTLARAGLSDGFLFPRYAEHYGPMTLKEAAGFDFDAAFSDSVLADHGIINLDELLADARKATLNGFDLGLVTRLWLALKLEVVLRRYA